jgi:adenylate kinase family enzyme
VLILGAPGSGKSYWAHEINQKLGLPLISLDKVYWQENWRPSASNDFVKACKELAEQDSWVMDGNFGSTFTDRWSRADMVVYLDPHPLVSYLRILGRSLGLKKKIARPEGCSEWRGLRVLHQLFWLVFKFRKAHGILISQHMRAKYPEVAFYRTSSLGDNL